MNEILSAFTHPNVWAGVVLTYSLSLIFKYVPSVAKSALRRNRLKELRKIKIIRRNTAQITFESIKANTYFLLFMGCSALFLVLVTMGPLTALLEMPGWILLLVCSPVIVTEIMWLNQSSYAKNLIKYHGKLRVTKSSN